jgi:FkbM family methyltransferase
MSQSETASPPAGVPTWKQRYWDWQARRNREQQATQLRRRLAALRRQADRTPRFQPGTIRLDGLAIHYDDLLSLYMEYKHIFGWGIYDFTSAAARPRVLDCGAHIGLNLLRCKVQHSDARVVAFEPDPRALEFLERNIAVNELTDVEVVPAALSTAHGMSQFVADGKDGGKLVDAAGQNLQAVRTVPLSAYLAEPVALLKMNIEGAELDVLQEAGAHLHMCEHIVLEYHGFPEVGQRLHEILALLDGCGFRYVVNHFDYETNPGTQPPFEIAETTRFVLLIAATRLWEPKVR